jgi:hypothetical protein
MKKTPVVLPGRMEDPMTYSPECDSEDVALRAICLHAERGRWRDLEGFGVDRETVELPLLLLRDTYGSFHSRLWCDQERTAMLRHTVPSLIPAAQSLRALYVMKTRMHTKLQRRAA